MKKAIKKSRILAFVLALAMGMSTLCNATSVEAASITKVATTSTSVIREGQELTLAQVKKAVKITKNQKNLDFKCDQVGKLVKPIESGKNAGKMKLTVHVGSSFKRTVYVPVNKIKSLSVSSKYNPVEGENFSKTAFKKATTVTASYEKSSSTKKKLETYTVTPSSEEVIPNSSGKFPVTVSFGKISKKVNLTVTSKYTVTVGKANGDSTVSVSAVGLSDGKVVAGKSVTAQATESSTYKFVKWIEGTGKQISTSSSYTFNVNSNISLLAVYEKVEAKKYYVTAIANNSDGVVTMGNSSGVVLTNQVNSGTQVTLSAVANSGYRFVAWKDSTGRVLSTATTFSVSVVSDIVAIATFESTATEKVTVNVSTYGNEGTITIDGSNIFSKKVEKGASVTVRATPNNGYKFKYWSSLSGTVVSLTSTYSFTVNTDTNIFAVFEKEAEVKPDPEPEPEPEQKVTVNISKVGNGTFSINEETVSSKELVKGANVVLTATANEGYIFTGWKNINNVVVSTEASYTFTATSDVSLIAVFEVIPDSEPSEDEKVTITVLHLGSGTVTINGETLTTKQVVSGDSITLVATASEGYTFSGWKNTNNVIETNATYSFTATEDISLIAVFTPIEVTTFETIDVAVRGNGTAVITGTQNTTTTVETGTNVSVTAIANTGYEFSHWENASGESVSTEATYTFTATEDISLIAVFKQIQVIPTFATIDVAVSGNGTAVITGTQNITTTVETGTNVSVTAIANTGYEFSHWENTSGESVSTESTYKFSATDDVTLTAVFKAVKVTVNISAGENGSVAFDGEEGATLTVDYGNQVTVKATANTGYKFSHWENTSGESVSTESTYKFLATDDVTLTAVFKVVKVTVNISAGENGSVAFDGEEGTTLTVDYGTLVTVVATPENGYKFVRFKDANNVTKSSNAVYSFTATSDITLTAVFNTPYVLNVNVEGDGSVKLDGANALSSNNVTAGNHTLVATAGAGYHFVQWENESGTFLSTSATYSVSVIQDTTVTAVFAEDTTVTVEFKVLQNTIKNSTVNPGESVTPPTDSIARSGYTFDGWELNSVLYKPEVEGNYQAVEYYDEGHNALSDAIATATSNGAAVVVNAVYTEIPTQNKFTLTLENGTIQSSGETSGNFAKGSRVTIVANEPETGMVFSGWYNGDTLICNTAIYTFSIPESNITYTAKYVEESNPVEFQHILTLDAQQSDNYSLLILMSSTVLNGYNKSGWGFLLAVDTDNTSFEINDSGVYKIDVSKDSQENNVSNTRLTQPLGETYVGHKVVLRPYMYVTDADSNVTVVYGNAVTITIAAE